MIKQKAGILLFIFILFLLDLIKPFRYFLLAEFLFLGCLVLSLNRPLGIALLASFICAWLRDFFIFSTHPIAIVEFPLLCLLIHYLRAQGNFLIQQRHIFLVKTFVAAFSLTVHLMVNSLSSGIVNPSLLLRFFIQSMFIYYLLDYLMNRKAYLTFTFHNV